MGDTTILISVGDDSGDLHASHLMRAIRRRRPGVRFVGHGMERMLAEGLELLTSDEMHSAMWLHNILRMGRYYGRLCRMTDYMDSEGVDLVLPIDFGGFNLYLSRRATDRGLPVFYYIPPQVWAHGRYRLKKLRKWITHAGLIYPFEPPLYDDYGVDATFVGHPLFDELQANPPRPEVVEALRNRFGPKLVGVFPGSREHEVRAHMGLVDRACRLVRDSVPEARFAMLATERLHELASELLPAGCPVEPLRDVSPIELARASAACLSKSGTVTLELATEFVPTVVFYQVPAFGRFHFLGLTKIRHVSVVNNVIDELVYPERLVLKSDAPWMARHLVRFLTDQDAAARCRRRVHRAIDAFGGPGATDRAADAVLKLLDGSALRKSQAPHGRRNMARDHMRKPNRS
jgi:lipid-A-disaccharide synthase